MVIQTIKRTAACLVEELREHRINRVQIPVRNLNAPLRRSEEWCAQAEIMRPCRRFRHLPRRRIRRSDSQCALVPRIGISAPT